MLVAKATNVYLGTYYFGCFIKDDGKTVFQPKDREAGNTFFHINC